MTDLEREIIGRLQAAREAGGRPKGLLFHGTCESFEGRPVGGTYDGVFWTADSPVIAQQYIPSSATTVLVHRPRDYEMGDHVRPNPDSWWNGLAQRMSGLKCRDVELDSYGRAKSWIVPEGWPTYADCVRYVEEVLGYRQERGGYEIRQQLVDGRFEDRPAGWQIQGWLYVTLSDGLRFKDMRRSEDGDLMDVEYHDLDGFARASEEGWDGVVINDFAQADGHGNVGHVSWGLLPRGLAKLDWVRIPAVRRPLECGHLTPDVEAWLAEAEAEPRRANVL